MKFLLSVLLLLLSVATAHAQTGFILVGPGTQRATCTAITAPVTNQTWCADGSLGPTGYNWFIWNGTAWVPISAGGVAGNPALPVGSIQFNNNAVFGGAGPLVIDAFGVLPSNSGATNSANIGAALTAACGGALYWPPGIYHFNAPIVWNCNLGATMLGAGMGNVETSAAAGGTFIAPDAGFTAFTYHSSTRAGLTAHDIGFLLPSGADGLEIRGDFLGPSIPGGYDNPDSTVYNITVQGGRNAIFFNKATLVQVTNLILFGFTGIGVNYLPANCDNSSFNMGGINNLFAGGGGSTTATGVKIQGGGGQVTGSYFFNMKFGIDTSWATCSQGTTQSVIVGNQIFLGGVTDSIAIRYNVPPGMGAVNISGNALLGNTACVQFPQVNDGSSNIINFAITGNSCSVNGDNGCGFDLSNGRFGTVSGNQSGGNGDHVQYVCQPFQDYFASFGDVVVRDTAIQPKFGNLGLTSDQPFTGQRFAQVKTAQGSNKDLIFTAVASGTAGNAVTIQYVNDGPATPLSVSVLVNAVTVHLATNGGGTPISTAAQIRTAILASGPAAALMGVSLVQGQDGSGVPAVFGPSNLERGGALIYTLYNSTSGIDLTRLNTITAPETSTVNCSDCQPTALTGVCTSGGSVVPIMATRRAGVWSCTGIGTTTAGADGQVAFAMNGGLAFDPDLIWDPANALLQIDGSTTSNGAIVRLIGDGILTPNKSIRAKSGAFQVLDDTFTRSLLEITDDGHAGFPASNASFLFTLSDPGVTGVNFHMIGNGVVTPRKTFRVHDGTLDIINDAYSVSLLSLTDAGAAIFSGPASGLTRVTIQNATASGASLDLLGDGSNPNKFLRAHLGNFEIMNTGDSVVLMSLGESAIPTFPGLASAGLCLITDAGGTLSTSACGGGPFSGSGAANQITVFSAATTLTGFSDFTWDDTNKIFNVDPAGTNNVAGSGGSSLLMGSGITETGGSNFLHGYNITNSGSTVDIGGFGITNSGGSAQILGFTITNIAGSVQLIGNQITNGSDDTQILGEQIINTADDCSSCVVVGQVIDFTGLSLSSLAVLSYGGLTGSGGYVVADSNGVRIGKTDLATAPEIIVTSGVTSVANGAHGQSANIKTLTEETTILVSAFTDTTIQAPANSLVLGVSVRVTTIIPTAATFDVGVAGATTRYGTGILVAATTTFASPGTTNPTIYGAATSIRITPNLMPLAATGKVRVTITYLDLTPPSS